MTGIESQGTDIGPEGQSSRDRYLSRERISRNISIITPEKNHGGNAFITHFADAHVYREDIRILPGTRVKLGQSGRYPDIFPVLP